MGMLALALVAAIITLMIASAVPSKASFLVGEAKNQVTMTLSSDHGLVAVVALVFLAVLAVKVFDHIKTTK